MNPVCACQLCDCWELVENDGDLCKKCKGKHIVFSKTHITIMEDRWGDYHVSNKCEDHIASIFVPSNGEPTIKFFNEDGFNQYQIGEILDFINTSLKEKENQYDSQR